MQTITLPATAPTLRRLALVAGLLVAGAAQAQFTMVPAPLVAGAPRESAAEIEKEYRIDGARHLYAAYPMRIFRGKLPPLMYAMMITETEIDATGNVVNVTVVREPAAAKEVTPWVVALIRRAGPFPAPTKMGSVKYFDIWAVDKSGLFQLDTLSEGQR